MGGVGGTDIATSTQTTAQKILLLILSLSLLIIIPLYLLNTSNSPQPYSIRRANALNNSTSTAKRCDIFRGKWVPSQITPYYTNSTCSVIYNLQNCLKFGRVDKEFLKWRWKPDQCYLPMFDAVQFLELVRGKSMAFVGDSVGRNHMQSLICLLARVVYPLDISYTKDPRYKQWLYKDYNFTLASFWSPHLVKDMNTYPTGPTYDRMVNLYLDVANEAWADKIELFNYIIISAGQWFFGPAVYYENHNVVGCYRCHINNVTNLDMFYGYRKAFRTTFQFLSNLKNFKGVTFLRTFSPAHFENGEWNTGGSCSRTRPVGIGEMKLEGESLEFYLTQVEELKKAEKAGEKKGLKFRLLDISEAMVLRPDGHPNHNGHSAEENVSVADCVHWCLPGPVDTWNEFLLHMLKMEG
ncbi:hypothetical protein LguiA_006216 [Lonicera macranthoides]